MQPELNVNEPKTNGIDETPKAEPQPQPAPRRVINTSQATNGDLNKTPTPTENHKKATPTTSLEGDDVQVLPKPITNEEFQAMIPAHFLNKSHNNQVNNQNPQTNPTEPTQSVTVTIKKPDNIELPPAPTGPGRVTETITKSTFTETVVTRITDNKLVMPLIIEVRQHVLPTTISTFVLF